MKIISGEIIMGEFETQEFDESKAMTNMGIIWFALVSSPIGFALIVAFLNGAPQSNNMSLFPAGFGLILMFVGVVLVGLVLRNPIKKSANSSQIQNITIPESPPKDLPLDSEISPQELKNLSQTPESHAFTEWQNNQIIRLAVLEGCALFNLMGVFIFGNVINFACTVVLVAFMIFMFPLRSFWESYRDDRVQQLISDDWQPPKSTV